MFNNDYDPYDHLMFVSGKTQQNEQNLDDLSGKVAELCLLVESMAEQMNHLTAAVVGLQKINKILQPHLERLKDQQ
jgi:uncharacterized coiled-coil protein SlyX